MLRNILRENVISRTELQAIEKSPSNSTIENAAVNQSSKKQSFEPTIQPKPVAPKITKFDEKGYPIDPFSRDDYSDAYMNKVNVIASVQEVKKLFLKDSLIIWYDPEEPSLEKDKYSNRLMNVSELKIFKNWEDAINFIEDNEVYTIVLSSVVNCEALIQKICVQSYIDAVYILCKATDYNDWKKKYNKTIVIKNALDQIISKIEKRVLKWQRKRSSLRVNLPLFSSIFNENDKSDNNHLKIYLLELTKDPNPSKSKKDFLSLARSVYQDVDNMDDFEKNCNASDRKCVLNWYTRDSFLFKLTNNCLRIATSDTILYSRFIISGLKNAIKEQYVHKSKAFHGLLYRGAYVSNEEWTILEQNQGERIEMYGFLSTSKVRDTAISFAQEDRDKKMLITIIVPALPDYIEVMGFAEMKEFSSYQDEDEVLFNIESKFTILETLNDEIDGTKYRHLVLLYGDLVLRSRLSLHSTTEMKIAKREQIRCCDCQVELSNCLKSLLFINLANPEEQFCNNCAKKVEHHEIPAFALVPCSPNSSLESIKMNGMLIKYNKKLNIPFYGYRCRRCTNTKFQSRYVCQNCQGCTEEWCNQCFDQATKCVDQGHLIVWESQPYMFWDKKLSESEKLHSKYDYKINDEGDVYLKTQEYQKALEYCDKNIEQFKNNKHALHTLYSQLGQAHRYLEQYDQAIEAFSKALEIRIPAFGRHVYTAESYACIGVTYYLMGQLEKALEWQLQALNIYRSNFGEGHPEIGNMYNNLGKVYAQLGQNEKAMEHLLKCIKITKDYFGENTPGVVFPLNSIGAVYQNMKQFEKARENFTNALTICRAAYGNKHPYSAHTYENLGKTYAELGQLENAQEQYRNALQSYNSINGSKRNILQVYNELGVIYQKMEQFDKARESHLAALKVAESLYGEKHSTIAVNYSNLGLAYKCLKQFEKGIECYNKALEIYKSTEEERSPTVVVILASLGTLYKEYGRIVEAKRYYSFALDMSESVNGKDHSHSVRISTRIFELNELNRPEKCS